MAGLGEAPKVLEIQLSIVGVQTADYTEKYSGSAFYSMVDNSLQSIAGLLQWDSSNVNINNSISSPNFQSSFQRNETPLAAAYSRVHLISVFSLAQPCGKPGCQINLGGNGAGIRARYQNMTMLPLSSA
jgi:hypothetical protein